jgi:hypothetical protein
VHGANDAVFNTSFYSQYLPYMYRGVEIKYRKGRLETDVGNELPKFQKHEDHREPVQARDKWFGGRLNLDTVPRGSRSGWIRPTEENETRPVSPGLPPPIGCDALTSILVAPRIEAHWASNTNVDRAGTGRVLEYKSLVISIP